MPGMDTQAILAQLRQQRDQLNGAISALERGSQGEDSSSPAEEMGNTEER